MVVEHHPTQKKRPQNQISAGSENFVGRPCRVSSLTWPTVVVAIERRSPPSPQQEEENQTSLCRRRNLGEKSDREKGNPSEQPVSPRKEPTGG